MLVSAIQSVAASRVRQPGAQPLAPALDRGSAADAAQDGGAADLATRSLHAQRLEPLTPPLFAPVGGPGDVIRRSVDTAFAAPVTEGSGDWPIVAALAGLANGARGAETAARPAADVTPGMVLRAYAGR